MRWTFAFALFLGLCPPLSQGAQAKETLTMEAIADPAYEAALWAITTGKVSDPDVAIKVDFMPIPAAMQAAMTQQYNIVGNGIVSVVQMVESGIPLKIIATQLRYNPAGHVDDFWVLNDSPIKTVTDLKGKSVAVASVEAQNVLSLRTIMSERYGMNPAAAGGDVRFVEMPAAQFEAALQAKRVDAAVFGNVPAYTAATSGKYRSILQGSRVLEEMYGGPLPSIVLFGYAADLEKRPQAYVAAAKLLKQSADYVLAHPDEVFPPVAEKYKMQAADLKAWMTTYGQMPNALGPTDQAVFVKVWTAAKSLGAIKAVPDLKSMMWEHAVVQ